MTAHRRAKGVIKAGDTVMCIDDSGCPELEHGQFYYVEKSEWCHNYKNESIGRGLLITGVKPDEDGVEAFGVRRFIKVTLYNQFPFGFMDKSSIGKNTKRFRGGE